MRYPPLTERNRVSTTTPPILLPGVDQHGDGFRVRRMFRGQKFAAIRPTPDAANALALEWSQLIQAGLPPSQAPDEQTVAQAADALLNRKRSQPSKRTKRPLRPKGIAWWERSLKPWRDGPLSQLPVSLLSRNAVEDAITARAVVAPKSARNEPDGRKAALRPAGS